MKKLAYLFATLILLAGCGNGATERTGKAESAPKDNDQVTIVEVTLKGDEITDLIIDETYKGSTKKTLKDDYKMKPVSGIEKEWWEQAEFLEKFIEEEGINAVGELDEEGKATNQDILVGCTMIIEPYITTTKEAVKNAK